MPASVRSTVCVIDDDPQVRRFLAEVLASIGVRAEEYASGEEFMRRWRPQQTGCVLLDIRMPRISGPEIHDWLRQRNPEIPVIFISGYADVPTAVRAMRLGAFDVIEKPFNAQHLIERINEALRLFAAQQAAASDSQLRDLLTPREREVLDGIIAGKRNKLIAADLGISERTVETHRASILTKTNAASTAELIAMAVGSG